ncbi:MAG: hypothetical protein EI684_15360 [Candidatus Viridilinea halotolerans]|uniref:Solute-binding protein family 5 domain-containing protein n=1 Tax=Candidatus Viridilinea halotolerans TaxID=2491704 RepID=A0A426TW55_9CHLR|nr:MAG: hypothetical protein EI684_15360 [Candidatus Viridilinea halotolerans]
MHAPRPPSAHRQMPRLLFVLLLLALLLAACGGAPAATPSNAPADAAAPASGPSGTLRFGFFTRFHTWDPHQESRMTNLVGLELVYDALLNEDLNGRLIPGLALEWNETPDYLDLTLREGVVFHDGTPFDAEAARANLLRARDDGAPPIKQQLAALEDVTVLDTYQLRLHLSRPVPDLLANLTRMTGMMISPAAFATAKDVPVGTGPWSFNPTESQVDVQYVFDAFPDFWDPQQQRLERVVILPITEQHSLINALRTGEIDAASVYTRNVAQLQAEGFNLLSNHSNYTIFQILDREGTLVPAFADERVRLALSYAIDRESFVDVAEMGHGMPTTRHLVEGDYGYSAAPSDLTYDPERARALLAEAGVTNLAFDVPSWGIDTELELIAGFFREVGVTMNPVPIAPGTLTQEAASGTWPAALVFTREIHVATFIANRVLRDGAMNPFKVVDPELEALATQAYTLPAVEAEPLWAELVHETAERGIVIHISFNSPFVVTAPHVQGGSVGYMKPFVMNLRGVTIEE